MVRRYADERKASVMIVAQSGHLFEWHRPDEIRTQLVYKCSVESPGFAPNCGRTLIREYNGLVADIPSHPGEGWRMIGGGWICPNHTVTITIDGKETEYK